MSTLVVSPRMDVAKLQAALQLVEPAAFLVEPRILRRVIKQDRRLAAPGIYVPHQHCYTIQRDRLLVIVDRAELNLSPAAELPRNVILLAEPTEGEAFEKTAPGELLHVYWRMLFHARIHLALEQRAAENKLDDDEAFRLRRDIGATEFDEIQNVLLKDDLLVSPASDLETYIEFVAVYLELRYFAPQDLPLYFPSIRDWAAVDRIVSRDVDHERLYWATRLADAPLNRRESNPLDEREPRSGDGGSLDGAAATAPARITRMVARAARASHLGNGVKAAIWLARAQRLASSAEEEADLNAAAQRSLAAVVERMRAALRLPDDVAQQWVPALMPLLRNAARDRWSPDARLLYDLQKVCLEQERGVYRVDLWGWLFSLGRRPMKRPLPLLRQVMITKHLRSAARRLATLHVPVTDRERLSGLLDDAFQHMDAQMRADLRPLFGAVLDEVDLTAENVPQRVARRKIIEEQLDRIVDRGFLNMGDLRDALSQNNLKLSDVSSIWEGLTGDQLLRADRKLGRALEGIYRPGAIYLRWPQRLSSLAFGTPTGRFLTQYIVLPYGAAFLAIEGLKHIGEWLHAGAEAVLEPSLPGEEEPAQDAEPADKSAAEQSAEAQQQQQGQQQQQSQQVEEQEAGQQEELRQAAEDTVTRETAGASTERAADSSVRDDSSQQGAPVATPAAKSDAGARDIVKSAGDETTEQALTLQAPNGSRAVQDVVHGQSSLSLLFFASVLTLGTLILLLIHRPPFRRWLVQRLIQLWKLVQLILIQWPTRLVRSPLVQKIRQSQAYALIHSYLLRPGFFSGLLLVPMIAQQRWNWSLALNVFLGTNLFLNSPIGRYADERVTDVLVRTWHELRIRVFAAVFHWVMEFFHQLLESLERSLYMVDEWLRFRRGDSRFFQLIKGVVGALWSIVRYVVRFCVTLLLEPQVNPIKHFPVVTVSHKILIPMTGEIGKLIAPFIGALWAGPVAAAIVLLLPGVFGFLVWELKGNWRLFAANRATNLVPTVIGHHGETMVRLLRPGFHSGTIPKLFARLRRASRRAEETGNPLPVRQRITALHRVQEAIRHFFDRELCALLEEDGTFQAPLVRTGRIHLATNRIDVELVRDKMPSVWLAIEERGGWLTAGIRQRGWIDQLRPVELAVWDAALAGIYKMAAVDLVHEQLDAGIGRRTNWYDITEAGIAVYTGSTVQSRVLYPLRRGRSRVAPESEVRALRSGWPVVRREMLVFGEATIPWHGWIEFWDEDKDHVRQKLSGLPVT